MTWKSTVLVSGATLVAGWLASERPAPPVVTVPPSVAVRSPQAAAAQSDIERQATRLQSRTRHDAEYAQPDRNLFQFRASAPARAVTPSTPSATATPPPAAAAPQLPPAPRLSLSGIATNPEGDRIIRTAVLSTPSGVLLVREGDDVLGQYRVDAVADDAVQLTRILDGSPLRLILTP